jgi:CheY-like chemotaxis protein
MMKIRPLQILIVDDDNGALLLMKIIFQRSGFNVETAIDGFVGLEKLKNYCPDLIITDDMMPGIDGNEFAKQVRENPQYHHIPIMVYGSSFYYQYDRWLPPHQVNEYLPKPTMPRDILKKARAYAVYGLVRNLSREDSTLHQLTLLYKIVMDDTVLTQTRLTIMEVMHNDNIRLAEIAFKLLAYDSVSAIRKQSAQYLSQFVDEESCRNLLMLLHDKDEFVALEAAKSLIHFSHFPIHKKILDVVHQTENTEILAQLVKVLQMSDELFVLHGLFDELIRQVTKSQNAEENRAVNLVLNGLGSWSAHDITRQVLSRWWDICNIRTYQALTRVLRCYPDDALLPRLLVDAQLDTVYPAAYACHALAAYHYPHVTQTLLDIATSNMKASEIRSAAILALSEHQDSNVYPTLQHMFQQAIIEVDLLLVAPLTRAIIQSNEGQSYGSIERGLNNSSSIVRRTVIEEMRVANTDVMFDLMQSYVSKESNPSTVSIMNKILDSEKVRQIFQERSYFQKK